MATSFAERDTAIVNVKGQVTIPKHLRDELALVPGVEVQFARMPNGRIELRPRTGSIEDLFGILKSPYGRPLTLDEMNEAAAEGAVASAMRGMERHGAAGDGIDDQAVA